MQNDHNEESLDGKRFPKRRRSGPRVFAMGAETRSLGKADATKDDGGYVFAERGACLKGGNEAD